MKKIVLFILILFTVPIFAESIKHNYPKNSSEIVNDIAKKLALQFNSDKSSEEIKKKSLAILSIVNINDFKSASNFGRYIAEDLIYFMKKYGYRVVDFKASDKITVNEDGDYIFTRKLNNLKIKRRLTYALSGTYTVYKDSITINCRIVHIPTGVVVSSAQVAIPKIVLKKIDYYYYN